MNTEERVLKGLGIIRNSQIVNVDETLKKAQQFYYKVAFVYWEECVFVDRYEAYDIIILLLGNQESNSLNSATQIIDYLYRYKAVDSGPGFLIH